MVAAAFLAEISGKNGLQIHIFASLTHFIAKIWRVAPVFQQDRRIVTSGMKLLLFCQLRCGFTATFRAYAKEERPSISRAFTKKAAASSH